jgi:hypothetical protein
MFWTGFVFGAVVGSVSGAAALAFIAVRVDRRRGFHDSGGAARDR